MIGRLYRLLVALYPESFRRRWGAELLASALELTSRARDRGAMPALRLTLRMALDLGRGALGEQRAERRLRPRRRDRISLRERSTTMFDGLAFDLRDALRGIRRAPLHAAGIVLTLALGIGANAAIFAVVYHVLLEPLPYAEPDRLVLLWEKNPERGWDRAQVAPANYLDWRERATTFASSAGFSDWLANEILSAPGEPAGVQVMYTVGDLFGVLGVPVAVGRSFGADEFWRAHSDVAVISDRLWRERFGAASDVIGRRVIVDGATLTVIGVAPRGFAFFLPEADLWRPFDWALESRERVWFRRAHMFRAVARLAPGATVGEAHAELETIAADLERNYPETNRLMGAGASLYSRWLTGDVERPLALVFLAVGLVLLVACANVAHLQLARATAREQEQAVRGCLGASRWRLARVAFTEQLLLGIGGGALGLLLARLGLPRLLAQGGVELPRLDEVRVGGTVVAFTLALTLVAALVAGVAPALRGRQRALDVRLRQAGRGGVGRRQARIRQVLLAAELMFAVVVVVGSLLVVRSFTALSRIDPGFEVGGVVTARIAIPSDRYSNRAAVGDFASRLLTQMRGLPGVRSAGLVRGLPTTSKGWTSDFAIEGRGREEFGIGVYHRELTEGYFETLRIPLVAGRLFDARDDTESPSVAIVNHTLAERYFPEGDAIGRRIAFDRYPDESSIWHEIVGVVGDEHQRSPAMPPLPEIFKPVAQEASWGLDLAVRSELPPEVVIPELRGALAEVDRDIPLLAPRTLTAVLDDAVGREHFLLVLFALFGALAVMLSALGVYAIAAHSAAGRRREVGVRMALGADRTRVVREMARRGLEAVTVGLVVGLGAAIVLGRAMTSFLYGIEPVDPPSLVVAPALLLALALLASWMPARRASRVAPAEVLRAE